MKNYTLLFMFGVLIVNFSFGQKPRYFTNTPLIFPIDYNSLYNPAGLASSKTVQINKDSTLKGVPVLDLAGKSIQNAYQWIYKNDTTFLASKIARQYYAFNTIKEVGDYYLIQYWRNVGAESFKKAISYYEAYANSVNNSPQRFKSTPTETANYVIAEGEPNVVNDTKDYYLVTKSDYESHSKEFENKKNKWSLGILLLPVKLRPFASEPSSFEFTDGFSLGTAFSFTHKYKWANDKSYSWVFYTGVSSISVDSLKTKGTTKSEKISAFSPALGYVIEKGGLQIGGFIGIDFPSGNVQKQWIYRNRPWIALGIGFSLFKIQNNENKDGGGTNEK